MCSEVLDELTLFSQELQRTLSPQALQQLAKKVGLDRNNMVTFPLLSLICKRGKSEISPKTA